MPETGGRDQNIHFVLFHVYQNKFQVQRWSAGSLPSSSGVVSLFPLRPSTDWMRPTHITEGNLLYSKSADLNVNLI